MKFDKNLVVIRGGGDIATGTIQKIKRAGFDVVILECSKPSSIRRAVCLSEAIYEGVAIVEDIKAVKVDKIEDVKPVLAHGDIAMLIDTKGESIQKLKPIAVIDAILAKKNLGTNKSMAPITIGLGPGFEAGEDVDIAIETMRGHNLGRLIFKGLPMADTGVPGEIKGISDKRVIYSNETGIIKNISRISDTVTEGQVIAIVGDSEIKATIDGILRGLIREGFSVKKGLKIADIDPREGEKNNCFTISDKARNIGGSSLEALLIMLNRMK